MEYGNVRVSLSTSAYIVILQIDKNLRVSAQIDGTQMVAEVVVKNSEIVPSCCEMLAYMAAVVKLPLEKEWIILEK